MECKLKIVLSDVHYIYAGYPHDDEEFQVSVWHGENRIPIGDVARTMRAAGHFYSDQRAAISEKYGSDFADKFLKTFSEAWWPKIDDDCDVYGRLSLCNPQATEEILRDLIDIGIEVEDSRSEESKRLSRDYYVLFHTDEELLCDELMAKENGGKLTRGECIAFLCEKFNVCKDAAEWYLDECCIYKFRNG
ncbi:MAG: hypothetical protein IJH50_06725 [Kiritimatiellae bacterium]|nr:hypothetical protein [Kiritimatiellia bacterium]